MGENQSEKEGSQKLLLLLRLFVSIEICSTNSMNSIDVVLNANLIEADLKKREVELCFVFVRCSLPFLDILRFCVFVNCIFYFYLCTALCQPFS